MHSMQDIERLARTEIRKHLGSGWTFRWDRAKNRAGKCSYTDREITLSRPIFLLVENRDKALNTILHEIAHALVGPGHGHDYRWQSQARALGIRPDRCHTMPTPMGKIVGDCRCGTATHERHRKPPARIADSYTCRRCKSGVTWRIRRPAERRAT